MPGLSLHHKFPFVKSSTVNVILAALAGADAGFGLAKWSPAAAGPANSAAPAVEAALVDTTLIVSIAGPDAKEQEDPQGRPPPKSSARAKSAGVVVKELEKALSQ